MENLHIFPYEKFTESYIKFINKNFDKEKHFFIVLGGDRQKWKGYEVIERANVKVLHQSIKNLIYTLKKMHKAKKIFLHSLFNRRLVILLFLKTSLIKKVYWIVWGGDLYCYRKERNKFKEKLYEFIRSYVIKNIKGVITLVKGDYKLAKEWYKVKGEHFEGRYVNDEKMEYLKKILLKEGELKKDFVAILLGNSATKSNNHLEALNLLKKYKSYKIKIYCPLSYGDENYAKEIIKRGKEIFDNKFIPMKDFMNMFEYMDFLNTVDVGIFNNDRQQGLGNINSLLYLGKKVYLRNSTSMWEELSIERGLKFFDIKEIEQTAFVEFAQIEQNYIIINRDILNKRNNNNTKKETWELIFNS